MILSNGTIIEETNLKDCYIITPKVFGDNRGYFSPYFIKEYLHEFGFKDVVQTNRSKSAKNILRGLHFQKEPYAQAKLVEVINGAAIDLVVDIRPNSETYMKYTYILLKPYNENDNMSGKQLLVPRGFAHGFVSLEDNTIFQYIIDNIFKPDAEDGLYWNDPKLNIPWESILNKYNISLNEIQLSEKDKNRKLL